MNIVYTDIACHNNIMYAYIQGISLEVPPFSKFFKLDTIHSTDSEIACCLAVVDVLKENKITHPYVSVYTDSLSAERLFYSVIKNKTVGRTKIFSSPNQGQIPWWNKKTFNEYILKSGYTLNVTWISREVNKPVHEELKKKIEFNTKRGIPIESWSPLFPTKFS